MEMSKLSTLDYSSSEILSKADQGQHIVQIYRSENYLAEAVGLYIRQAMAKKEAVVIIATPQHQELFKKRLSSQDIESYKARGLFHFFDADGTLSKFMQNGMPQWALFNETIGEILNAIRRTYPSVKVSAYGEMVNILWHKGNIEGAIALEEYWNDLAKIHKFSLFCAYYLDGAASEMEAHKLKKICDTHSHFIPSEANPYMEQAMGRAIQHALGNKSLVLRMLIEMLEKKEKSSASIPDHLATLIWLEENMPQTAAEVKALALEYLSDAG